MKFLTLIIIFFSLSVFKAKASVANRTDTIYYLLDTVNTPVRDRIISTEDDLNSRLLTINCHCMKNFETPLFLFNPKEWMPLKRNVFGSIKLLTLVKLMELTRAVNSVDFQLKYVFYIIEPKGNEFVKYRAISLSREKRIGDDQPIIVGKDTVTKHN